MSEDGYYTEAVHGPHEFFDLGDLQLASGFTCPARSWRTRRSAR